MSDFELTDIERHPTLSVHGRQMLEQLTQHPHAPVFRNRAGSRLTPDDLARVRALQAEVRASSVSWRENTKPAWLAAWVERVCNGVPFYRARGVVPSHFEDITPVSRADLANDIAQFVPDSAPLDRLINFRTSGTTGHPLVIPSHPVVAASYLSFHQRAMQRFGITLRGGRGSVCVALLGYQRQCFTYASVAPTLDEAGYVKLNLHPGDWRDPADRALYLDALRPEIFSGDPLSFAALLELPLTWKPRALVSTAMALSPALRAQLEARFECPVLDVYSMSECGPIAVADTVANTGASGHSHVLLQHQLYVEILDAAGCPCKADERGEITLSGGFNFCLPLLRYRTGDYASLQWPGGEPVLVGLEGRAPVRFRAVGGAWVNNVEITHALRLSSVLLPLQQFCLHQQADGAFRFEYAALEDVDQAVTAVLRGVFGPTALIAVTRRRFDDEKIVQYSSDVV